MKPTALYRHYDESGALLYVGISLRPVERLAQHGEQSHWANNIASVTIEWLPTREEAAHAELRAIAAENPLHNIVGKLRPRAAPAAAKPEPAKVPEGPQWVSRPEAVAVHFNMSLSQVMKAVAQGMPRERGPDGKWRYDITAWKAQGRRNAQEWAAAKEAAKAEASRSANEAMREALRRAWGGLTQ